MSNSSAAVAASTSEFSPMLQVRFKVSYDVVYSALLINISRIACQLFTTTTLLHPGDHIQVQYADIDLPVGTIRGVSGRITSVGFNRPVLRATMDRLITAEPDRRWECDYGPARPFQSVRSFSFTNDSARPEPVGEKNLIALKSGLLVSDKRRSSRKAVLLPGACRGDLGDSVRVVISDLTSEGCCISGLSVPLSAGEKIILRPQSLEELPATVRWVSEGEAGVQFDSPLYAPVAEHLQSTHAAFLSDEQRALLRKLNSKE